MNETIKTIKERRAIRSYKDMPIVLYRRISLMFTGEKDGEYHNSQ